MMLCKISMYKEYVTCLYSNTNDNYNDIATITPMTTPIITPVLSSPPPLASTENIICYMDNNIKHLDKNLLYTVLIILRGHMNMPSVLEHAIFVHLAYNRIIYVL